MIDEIKSLEHRARPKRRKSRSSQRLIDSMFFSSSFDVPFFSFVSTILPPNTFSSLFFGSYILLDGLCVMDRGGKKLKKKNNKETKKKLINKKRKTNHLSSLYINHRFLLFQDTQKSFNKTQI
jgi:hypothetical protein